MFVFSGPLCPAGFVSFGESSDCFYYMTDQTTQADAGTRCAAVGAALADVREANTLKNFHTWHGNGASRLWTGITDKAEVCTVRVRAYA